MLGNGIGLAELMQLLNSVREKKLTLQVKVVDNEWEDISKDVVKKMIKAVESNEIIQGNDIKLRLFEKK